MPTLRRNSTKAKKPSPKGKPPSRPTPLSASDPRPSKPIKRRLNPVKTLSKSDGTSSSRATTSSAKAKGNSVEDNKSWPKDNPSSSGSEPLRPPRRKSGAASAAAAEARTEERHRRWTPIGKVPTEAGKRASSRPSDRRPEWNSPIPIAIGGSRTAYAYSGSRRFDTHQLVSVSVNYGDREIQKIEIKNDRDGKQTPFRCFPASVVARRHVSPSFCVFF